MVLCVATGKFKVDIERHKDKRMSLEIQEYVHTVQYYETDKMGITHHSNYIRWMEEARVYYLDQIGWSFAKLEELGIGSPVTSLDAKYKQSTTFSDVISIRVWVEEFKGVKLQLGYHMKNADGKIVCEASSQHCFVNKKGMPVRVDREYPEFYEKLLALKE